MSWTDVTLSSVSWNDSEDWLLSNPCGFWNDLLIWVDQAYWLDQCGEIWTDFPDAGS